MPEIMFSIPSQSKVSEEVDAKQRKYMDLLYSGKTVEQAELEVYGKWPPSKIRSYGDRV